MNTDDLTLFLPVAVSLVTLIWLAMSVLTLAVWVWTGWHMGDAVSSLVTSLNAGLGKIFDTLDTALLMWVFFRSPASGLGYFVAVALSVFWFKRRRAMVSAGTGAVGAQRSGLICAVAGAVDGVVDLGRAQACQSKAYGCE